MTTTQTTSDARLARLDAIRDAAIVARMVGISASYRRLPDGRHDISLHGQSWTGDTLTGAIAAATRRRG